MLRHLTHPLALTDSSPLKPSPPPITMESPGVANGLPFLSPAFSPEASFAFCGFGVFLFNMSLCKRKGTFKPDVPVLVIEKKFSFVSWVD